MAPSFGAVLKQARGVRQLSVNDTARAAGISAAYLSRLESDAVRRCRYPTTS
jgi:transcriptional regulator with XRE-family HTH domain